MFCKWFGNSSLYHPLAFKIKPCQASPILCKWEKLALKALCQSVKLSGSNVIKISDREPRQSKTMYYKMSQTSWFGSKINPFTMFNMWCNTVSGGKPSGQTSPMCHTAAKTGKNASSHQTSLFLRCIWTEVELISYSETISIICKKNKKLALTSMIPTKSRESCFSRISNGWRRVLLFSEVFPASYFWKERISRASSVVHRLSVAMDDVVGRQSSSLYCTPG